MEIYHMIKQFLLTAAIAAALIAPAAFAATKADATVSVQSNYVYRGESAQTGATVGLDLRFNDVVLPGLFVTSDFDTTQLTPFNGNVRVRSDFGVGYEFTRWNTKFDVSVNHVFNPLFYSADYTELRGRVGYGPVYAEVGQGLTSNVNRDTYVAVGAEHSFLTPKLIVGGKVSAKHYNLTDFGQGTENHFNNAEAYASYNVWRGLDLTANYSFGGTAAQGRNIGNYFWGGLQYRF
jgi:uncharacterized protein (TIGR02001 family)